jgi:hypothetical protein
MVYRVALVLFIQCYAGNGYLGFTFHFFSQYGKFPPMVATRNLPDFYKISGYANRGFTKF